MVFADEERCVGCGACVPYCPVEALRAWGNVEVNSNCTECLICIDYCPVGALEVRDESR